MEFKLGERAEFTVTGTVISAEEFAARYEMSPALDNSRELTHLLLDNGVITRIDTSDDERGMQGEKVKPRYWPPVNGDAWFDDNGNLWYTMLVDFGNRKGLRLKRYTELGEVLRSAQAFLNDNVAPRLVMRGDELVQW